jgi:trimeric autotransporter adhesin
MKKIILENVRIILIAAIFSLGLGVAYAWTGPTGTPPNNNVSNIINGSATGQSKVGNLVISTQSGPTNGLVVAYGNVGIGATSPAERLEVSGNAKATAFLYSSDINLKKDIKPLENELDKVLALQPVSFDWKSDSSPDIGFIAQEVEKIFPEVVHTSPITNLKSIDYPKLTVFLVQALQEQQKEIEQLKLNK